MEIYAICETLKGGTEYDKKEMADNNIQVGDRFELTNARVGGWKTEVYFNKFPNVGFNSIYFRFEDEDGEPVDIISMEEFGEYI